MTLQRKSLLCALIALLYLAVGAAAHAAPQAPAPAKAQAAPQVTAPAPVVPPQAAPQPQPAPAPQIDTAELAKHVNKEAGFDIRATTAQWKRDLDRLEGEVRRQGLRYVELNNVRDELQRVRTSVDASWNALRPRLDSAKAEVELLGPAPAAGQPPETEQLAIRRAELNYRLGVLSEGQSAVNAAHLRIEQLGNDVQEARRKNFTTRLFQRVPGVYGYKTWAETPSNIPYAANRVANVVAAWWNNLREPDEVAHVAVEAAVLWIVLSLFALWAIRRLRSWRGEGEPPFWSRASSAAGVILLRVTPIAAPIVFSYVSLAEAHNLPESLDWIFYSIAQSAIVIWSVYVLVVTAFAPSAPQWRLIACSNRAAFELSGLVLLLALIYGVASVVYVVTLQAKAPLSLMIVTTFCSSVLSAAIVVAILLTPLEAERVDGLLSLGWARALRLPAWIMVAAILVTALSGYLSLSRFLARQLVVTGSILALVYLLLLWVEGFAQCFSDDATSVGRWLKGRAGLDKRRREQLAVPVSLFLKLALLALAVPLIMAQWGYAWPDIFDWYRQLFFDLHIANTQVSVAALCASFLVFGLAYAAARFFQGWLDDRILKPAGISGGVRDSIRIAVGYVGVAVAALAAFSYAGVNLSSLAMVAGALSVGIGFGLQSVVNNFVSGLILLAERPIKIGDLVVVAGEEGYVRKISIRSTEVETFDRAHVLVPNSYFITEKVKNWTHRNSIRRMSIAVTVDCLNDPREVRAALLQVARENPDVLSAPAPSAVFEDFGDSFNFKLFVYYDTSKDIQSDLRVAILEAFHRAGFRKMAYLCDDRIPQRREARDDDKSAPRLARSEKSGAYS